MAKKSSGGATTTSGATCDNWSGAAWLFLIVGILYLLTDLTLMSWWKLNWWTVLFIIIGLVGIMKK